MNGANEDKTQMIALGPQGKGEKVKSGLGSLVTKTKSHVKNLDVIMDCDVNFKSHTHYVAKIALFHLRNFFFFFFNH